MDEDYVDDFKRIVDPVTGASKTEAKRRKATAAEQAEIDERRRVAAELPDETEE